MAVIFLIMMAEEHTAARYLESLTFTSYGCDKSTVTVTPTRHPVTDKVLHDIVVNVNTSSGQPIDSTCRFQYVLNEL
ncbi:StfH/YfcO family fimbrial adhesin [Escherichia coli]